MYTLDSEGTCNILLLFSFRCDFQFNRQFSHATVKIPSPHTHYRRIFQKVRPHPKQIKLCGFFTKNIYIYIYRASVQAALGSDRINIATCSREKAVNYSCVHIWQHVALFAVT